jgi:hypothetical protein
MSAALYNYYAKIRNYHLIVCKTIALTRADCKVPIIPRYKGRSNKGKTVSYWSVLAAFKNPLVVPKELRLVLHSLF